MLALVAQVAEGGERANAQLAELDDRVGQAYLWLEDLYGEFERAGVPLDKIKGLVDAAAHTVA